jgi:hypothetical protein
LDPRWPPLLDSRPAWPPVDPLGRSRGELAVLRISTVQLAFVLSLLFHAAVLFGWIPRPHDAVSDRVGKGTGGGPLAVRLAPAPSVTTSAPPATLAETPAPAASPPPAAKRAPTPRPAPRPPPPPKVAAKAVPAPAAAPLEPPAVAPAQPSGDFFAELEARRRARGASSADSPANEQTGEDERERHNRIVAENLGLNRVPTYGREPTGGGIFQLERVGYADAEFLFFGWNKDIRRRARQLIVVERGANPSIEIAIVRRMIVIIREHESGDFTWRSQRLGRDVTLSARAADTTGLEEFLMREFFPERRPG